MTTSAQVQAVSLNPLHALGKPAAPNIRLIQGLGVKGDAHFGASVQHRSRVARDPSAANLRQVHLIGAELLEALRLAGFAVAPGQMGENITTVGLDLLALPQGARLHIGATAVVEITGLRNPCVQLDGLYPGLMAATLSRDAAGALVRKAGVMGIVAFGGEVAIGDQIEVEAPAGPIVTLRPV